MCFSENKFLFLKFQRNKVFYPKKLIQADPRLRLLFYVLCVCRGKEARNCVVFSIEGRWLPASRLSVRSCANSDLSPDPTHLLQYSFLPSPLDVEILPSVLTLLVNRAGFCLLPRHGELMCTLWEGKVTLEVTESNCPEYKESNLRLFYSASCLNVCLILGIF